MNMARCLLAEAKLHKFYWPEIICAATYLKNCTLANTIERKTPYEIFFKRKPNVEHLRLYGSKVFVRKPEQNWFSKWDKKAEMGILLGYSDAGDRVLINNKIIVARHIDTVEENVKCIGFDEVVTKHSSCSTSTLESSRGEENDGDSDLSDNVFEDAEEYKEQQGNEKEKINLCL